MTDSFLQTLVQRPYVFAFLAAFLFLALKRWGWQKTIVWLISGYSIAWLSEISSIHNGFPYGDYKYLYENMQGELMIFGVPFFDSLSYPFLAFASFTTASFLISPYKIIDRKSDIKSEEKFSTVVLLVFLGAFLTMLLDIMVDPVATMGDKWFLGKIHYYVHPGWYFGVPMSNFAGWFLVAFCIIAFNVSVWHLIPGFFGKKNSDTKQPVLEPMFYISVAVFQTIMAFVIDEMRLGMVNTMIISALSVALLFRRKQA